MDMPNYYGWPGNIWIFSDPHFNHENVLKFERSQFSNIIEHNNAIVKGINSVAKKTDTLICLGDLGYNWTKYIEEMNPETKILIMGNHDKESKSKYFEVFQRVFDGPTFLNQFILLSHEPWYGCEYCFNIHGHLHSSYLDNSNYINANIAMTNYTPINAKNVYSRNAELKRNHEHFLNEWYANQYYFVTEKKIDAPLVNHKLPEGFEKIIPTIEKFNSENHTAFRRHDINWSLFKDGDNIENFTVNYLNKLKGGDKVNEDSEN